MRGAIRPLREDLLHFLDRPFRVLTWFGWTLCRAAISWIVLSPRSCLSSATFALNSPVNGRRVVIAYPSLSPWNSPWQLSDFRGPPHHCAVTSRSVSGMIRLEPGQSMVLDENAPAHVAEAVDGFSRSAAMLSATLAADIFTDSRARWA